MIFRSLRSRLFAGSLLWMLGIALVMGAGALAIFHTTVTYPVRVTIHRGMITTVVIIFVVAGLWFVRSGLAPFGELRKRLTAVRGGSELRVQGRYPAEVQPLVDELNALLDDRERAVARARATAGDLAHGLKTPLAVLSQEAERAEGELADTIAQQVERMRRQVDYHLAHARANAAAGDAPGVRCSVADSAEGLARTMRRLHAGRALAIQTNVAPQHAVRCRRDDLDEMLGNLLDNACKWALGRVVVTSALDGDHVVIDVDDDGPGLDPTMRDAVLLRGVRADEAAPGSGLGLAIVRDLAEVYGGSITLDAAPLGGVRARLSLPAPAECPSPRLRGEGAA